jgi:hypothetical protein
MIGVVVPGRPVMSPTQIAPDRFMLEVDRAGYVSFVTFFLTMPLPDTLAATVSVSLPPFTTYTFVGHIDNKNPSATLNLSAQLAAPPPHIASQDYTARIGITIEALGEEGEAQARALASQSSGQAQAVFDAELARRVGVDLLNFVASFSSSGGAEVAFVTRVVETWLKRVKDRCAKDPTWIYREPNL